MTRRILTLAVAVSLGAAGPALAHAHLRSSVPAAGATVAAPTELDLSFSEGVNPKFTGLTMTGLAGAAAPTGVAKLGPGHDTMLVVPVTGALAPGAYTVRWHALATDGHRTEGSYSFTVEP